MAHINSPSANAINGRRDGDWLLSYNRRLRNLNAISLRNLSLASGTPSKQRRQTADDDAVPQTLQSPAKLLALREYKTFSHSRSSTDLRSAAESAVIDEEDAENHSGSNGSPVKGPPKTRPQTLTTPTPRRPDFKRTRRSTLEWTNATAHARQERLESVADEHMANVFVSLHIRGVGEPVYVSETIHRTMNPSFRQIDWSGCNPGVTRADQVILRIWARGGKVDRWRQVLDMTCHLKGLRYLSKNLDMLDHPLPPNAVLFHMADGVYLAPTDPFLDPATTTFPSPPSNTSTSSSPRALPTASFDALLRLAKLDDSIQDALATRSQLAASLETLVRTHAPALQSRDRLSERIDRLETLDFAKKTVERQLDKARRQHSERCASLSARRALMTLDSASRASLPPRRADAEFPSLRAEHLQRASAILAQRRRVCEDLQVCFPISPRPGTAGRALAFTIRGLPLPNAEDLDSEPFDLVAAALGHVAHVLLLLAAYHAYPLPYPLNPRGSSSTVADPISILKSNPAGSGKGAKGDGGGLGDPARTYPLFSKGVPRFRFEYAVFLLNQDIRVLLEGVFGARVPDVRQTLPNLKYLLYVATAGEGELPARKAGGVRGLLRPAPGRAGSAESGGSSVMSGGGGEGKGEERKGDAVGSLLRFGMR